MVQGKEMEPFIQFYLEPEILQSFGFGYEKNLLDLSPRIGVDESGKGDFFGPLCVAGVYATGDSILHLADLGVKDSKKLSDDSILKIAQKVKKDYQSYLVRINPEKYNELYEKFGNLNLLLAWGHATVIENLVEQTDCETVIVDQFAAEHVVENALKRKKRKVLLTQRTRAEQDLVVAAASILARAAFLEGIDKLGQTWGLIFPKGASSMTIQAGKQLVREHGNQALNQVGKMHFKTAQVIIT
jgi:ribonuclease HIII